MTIGKTIRSIRKEKGITQKKLAELSGIAEITIRQYEADKYKPKIEQVKKIAAALNVSPFDIVGSQLLDVEETGEKIKLKTLQDYSTLEILQELERRCLIGSRKEL